MRLPNRDRHVPSSWTRHALRLGLVVAGGLAGALFGIALTKFGKLMSGAPPATLANYVHNAVFFGVLAAIVSPLVSWWALRRAPLWRTIAEPLGYAVGGGTIALLIGVPVLMLILPPLGLALGFYDLHRRYPEPRPLPARPAGRLLPVRSDADD